MGTVTFGEVLRYLQENPMKGKASRNGWHGKNQWIALMERLRLPPFNTQDTVRKVNDRTAGLIGPDAPLDSQPYLVIYDEDMQLWQPGWVPSQADMLSNDWVLF